MSGKRLGSLLLGVPWVVPGREDRLRLLAEASDADLRGSLHPQGALNDPTDPRWVLAVRTAEQFEGSVLGPERRQQLIRLGQMLGLNVFDTNLIIAIVQDQARRGHVPSACPAAGESRLAMVRLPANRSAGRRTRWLVIGAAVAMILTMEAILLKMWLF